MEIKNIKISDLKPNTTQLTILSDEFIERIKAFKWVLVEVEPSPLNEVIRDIQYDAHPEREIKVWEHIGQVYQDYILAKNIKSLSIKQEVFEVLLLASTGLNELRDFKNIRLLSTEQISEILYNYNPLTINDIL